jgi:hypothetical protein
MDPEVRERRVGREEVEELETILSQAEAMDLEVRGRSVGREEVEELKTILS